MRINQFLSAEQGQDRALEEPDDIELGKQHKGDDDAEDDGARYPEEALAQLLQVIQERHFIAWSFAHSAGASRLPLPYFIDCRRSSARAASSERGNRLMISWNKRLASAVFFDACICKARLYIAV